MSATYKRGKGEATLRKGSDRNGPLVVILCSLLGYVLSLIFINSNLNPHPRPSAQLLLMDTVCLKGMCKDTVVDTLKLLEPREGASKKLLLKKTKELDARAEGAEEDRMPVSVTVNCCCPGSDSTAALARDTGITELLAAMALNNHRPDGGRAHLPTPTPWPIADLLFNRNTDLAIWAMLVCMMTAFAFACAPIFVDQWLRLRALFNNIELAVWSNLFWALLVGLVLLLAPTMLKGLTTPVDFAVDLRTFFDSAWALMGPLGLTVLCAGIGIALMFSISAGIGELGATAPNPSNVQGLAERFDALNKALRLSLQLLAVMVAFAVLTSNSLRMAFVSLFTGKDAAVLYPLTLVHLYGLFHSAMLAMIYLPIHYRLTEVGQPINEQLKQMAAGQSGKAGPVQTTWLERAINALTLSENGLANLKLALSILAPTLATWLAKYLEVGP